MKTLYLFTEKFPYKGGEPFLETEIHYLSAAFDKVIVYPLTGHGTALLEVPTNIEVRNFNTNQPVYLRKLLLKHGWVIAKWFLIEFIKSPHRFKYITQFRWNFKRIVGLLNNAALFKTHHSKLTTQNSTFYSYWFNDWASMLSIAKQLGLKGKFVSRTHGFDFDEQQQARGYHPFRYVELPKFDKVFQVSEYGQNYISKRFPRAKNIEVSKLGVTEKGTNPISLDKLFHIVSCSNFVPLKRVHLIVEILSHLSIPFHWTHFGAGKGMEEAEEKAKRLLNKNAYTFKGYVANAELMDWYKSHSVDLFVNVSNLEGLPVSLMEAISFGIPIVGCKICGVPEIVTNQTGILLEVDFKPKEATAKIESFLKTQSRERIFREGVKEIWKENFDADKNYTAFANSLNRM